MDEELQEDVFEKKFEKFKLTLEVFNDIELHLDISTTEKGVTVRAQEAIDFVKSLELNGQIDNNAITDACAMARLGKDVKDAVVMNCKKSTPNKTGSIEFLKKPFTESKKNYATNEIEEIEKDKEKDKKDYHNLHLFDNVKLGQAIAKIIPPQKGVKGISLRGEVILSEPVKNEFKCILGEGVRMGVAGRPGEEANLVIAKKNGMILYDDKTHVITISNEYTINGDVGYNTGNINFIGSVFVKGDVVDSFHISAGKNIAISGHIEGSKILAGGTLEFGGVSALNQGLLESQGNMTGKYVDAANIICYGNLEVKNEIIDSDVTVRGSVEVTKGSIIGGRVMALKGIESRTLGSEIGVKTRLIAGVCFISSHKIQLLNETINKNKKRLEDISKIIDPLIGHPELSGKLSKEKKLQIRKLMVEFTHLNKEEHDLLEKIESIEQDVIDKKNPIITVWKTLFNNVNMTLDKTQLKTSKPIAKKMSLVPNSRDSTKVRYMGYIALQEKAIRVEREYSRAEEQEEKKS